VRDLVQHRRKKQDDEFKHNDCDVHWNKCTMRKRIILENYEVA
jgi:hypothetical protein